jgi:hypothetical protein
MTPRELRALLGQLRRHASPRRAPLSLLTLNELRRAQIAQRDGEGRVVEALLARARDRLAAGWTWREWHELNRAKRGDERLITVPHPDAPSDRLRRLYVSYWRDPLDSDRWHGEQWHVDHGLAPAMLTTAGLEARCPYDRADPRCGCEHVAASTAGSGSGRDPT